MSSAKARTTDELLSEHLARRSSAISMSLPFRSSAKRESIIGPREEQPACLEKVHYPVFDPEDPRHNTRIGQIFRRSGSRTTTSDSQRQPQESRTLPRKSLHKAKSGLLASLFHRSSRRGSEPLEPLPKHAHTERSSHGLSDISSTTQEDLSFGTALYRNRRAQKRTLDDTDLHIIAKVLSCPPLKNTMSAPQPITSSSDLVGDLRPPSDETVSPITDESPVHERYQDTTVTSHLPTNEKSTKQDPPVIENVEEIRKNNADYLTPSVASEDRPTAGRLSSSSADDEELGGTTPLCDNQDVASVRDRHLLICVDNEKSVCKKIAGLRRLSETRNFPSLEMEHKHNGSKESLPDYSTPSIADSETPQRGRSIVSKRGSFVTQERVLLGDDSLESEGSVSPVSESRKCSADVKIAFPGLYHELLEQWIRETEGSPTLYPGFPGFENENTSTSAHLPSLATTTTTTASSQHNLDGQQHRQAELPWSVDTRFASGIPSIFNSYRKTNTLIPSPSLPHPRVVRVYSVQDSVTLPYTMDDYTRHTGAQPARSGEEDSDRRRNSFGIHISERNEPTSRTSTTQVSRREILRGSSEDQQSPVHARPFFRPPGLWGSADSQCDDSDFTIYTRDSSVANSTNYTSPTSISSTPWSPLDSPIDEEVLFRTTHRDEYYMADGKHSSYYPDRGDLPVKVQCLSATRPGYHGPSGYRAPPNRLRLTRETLTNTMRRSFRPDPQRNEEQEDNEPTEDATSSSRAQV